MNLLPQKLVLVGLIILVIASHSVGAKSTGIGFVDLAVLLLIFIDALEDMIFYLKKDLR